MPNATSRRLAEWAVATTVISIYLAVLDRIPRFRDPPWLVQRG